MTTQTTEARQAQADRLRRTLSRAGCYPTIRGSQTVEPERGLAKRTLLDTLDDMAATDAFAVLAVALTLKGTDAGGDWRTKPALRTDAETYPPSWWAETLRINIGYTFYLIGGLARAVRQNWRQER